MVRAERSSLPRNAAMPTIREGLLALRKDHEPEAVLAALQERSGVLRGASEELVEFSHNTLKSYFAARRLVPEAAGQKEVVSIPELAAFPNLQGLRLNLTEVSDDGLAHLEAMTGLKMLLLFDTQADPEHAVLRALRARGVEVCC
jgi:hypothetical protein